MRWMKATHGGAVLGWTLAVPTRNGFEDCCARNAIGHVAAAPTAPRNCRRCMSAPSPIGRHPRPIRRRNGYDFPKGLGTSVLGPFADYAMHLFEMLAHLLQRKAERIEALGGLAGHV